MASAGDPAVILCKLEPVKRRRRHLGPKWPSVTAMLADLAEGLHAGRPNNRAIRARERNGRRLGGPSPDELEA